MAYNNLKELFVGTCDALRTKKGTTEEINHQDIPTEILALLGPIDLSEIKTNAANVLIGEYYMDANGEMQPGTMPNNGNLNRTYTSNGSRVFSAGWYSGGTITIDVPASEINNTYGNASEWQVRSGATFMSGGVERVGTMGDANVSISVNSSGKITATNNSAGYLTSGSAATKQLTTQAAQTITPGTSNQTISSGTYLTGTQTILGDSDLIASNIKNGVSIFGVTGTYAGSVPTYSVGSVSGADSGFLMGSDGYYSNTLEDHFNGDTFGICKVSFENDTAATITIDCSFVNECGCGAYGFIGKVDTYIDKNNITDSLLYAKITDSASGSYSMTIPAGSHYVLIGHSAEGFHASISG